jgi:hypothetical protein
MKKHVYKKINFMLSLITAGRDDELDDFLNNYGLRRVETSWDGITWGDAFYAKKFSV